MGSAWATGESKAPPKNVLTLSYLMDLSILLEQVPYSLGNELPNPDPGAIPDSLACGWWPGWGCKNIPPSLS